MTGQEELLKKADEMVRKNNWNVAQREGKKLQHVRASEITEEHKRQIASITGKHHEGCVFGEGVLTWDDMRTVVGSVWDLQPNSDKLMPRYMEDKQQFVEFMAESKTATPESPIQFDYVCTLEAGSIKIHAAKQPNGIAFGISNIYGGAIDKLIAAETWNKLDQAGLPLIDNRWLFES